MIALGADIHSLLVPGDIHLWALAGNTKDPGKLQRESRRLLSDVERLRLGRLRHAETARRYLAGRVLLRQVLGRYLGVNPAQLKFSEGANGKPQLAAAREAGIAFNLSHARKESVLAVSQAEAIGVDIEDTGRFASAYRISQVFFAEEEKEWIRAAGAVSGSRALTVWLVKESVLKARGDTVWDGLGQLPLSICENRIVCDHLDDRPGFSWYLVCGHYGTDCLMAICWETCARARRTKPVIRCFRLGDSVAETKEFTLTLSLDRGS